MLDNVAGVRDDTRAEHLSFGHFDSLEQVILVLVAGIRRFETKRAGIDFQDVLDDVRQRGFVKARPFVDAVAGVEADSISGNAFQGRVDGLDIDCAFRRFCASSRPTSKKISGKNGSST